MGQEYDVFENEIDFKEYIPNRVKDMIGEIEFQEAISECFEYLTKNFQRKFKAKIHQYYRHPDDGICYVQKITSAPKNKEIRFLKLYHPGYEWDDNVANYWNGMMFLIPNNRWFNAKK